MPLQFIGDAGIYFPVRDAIRITALSGDHVIDCYVTRSALDYLGCNAIDARIMAAQFQKHRATVETVAMLKHDQTKSSIAVEITREDIQALAAPAQPMTRLPLRSGLRSPGNGASP